MSSADGQDNDNHFASRSDGFGQHASVETMLFESLVHQLIEKGLLTKNDALSVIQTVAQVKQGRLPEQGNQPKMDPEVAVLRRLYESFEALSDRSPVTTDHANVRQLRPPLHQDAPEFPQD